MSDRRREIKKECSYYNLKAFQEVMDKAGIKFWISCGTLLGIYRDGDLIKHDEDDVDITIWKTDTKKFISALQELKDLQFRFHPLYFKAQPTALNAFSARRGKSEIHINFMLREKRTNSVFYWMSGVPNTERHFAYVFPAHLFNEFRYVEWRGLKLRAPKDTEGYFNVRYKIWKKPILVGEGWTHCRDKEMNPCCRDDLIFDNFKYYEIDEFKT